MRSPAELEALERIATQGTRRRYLNLRARAADQSESPEGELCKAMADRMLERCPDLADIDGEDLPGRFGEYRYKTPEEKDLLVRVGKYLGVGAQEWAGSRKKLVLFWTDEPTHAAIDQTFAVLREKLAKVILFAYAGFCCGALHLPREDCEESGGEDHDPALLEMARSAMGFGRDGQPRKAISSGGKQK